MNEYPYDLSIKMSIFFLLNPNKFHKTDYFISRIPKKNQSKIYFLGIFFLPTPTFSPRPLLLTKIPLPFGLYSLNKETHDYDYII